MLSKTSAVNLQPAPFRILQDDWVMLAPLGDHPHALGVQRFTPAFMQNMATRFNGFLSKLGRLFSGAPTFEGHHDIEPDKYPNSRSYGWIMSLEARSDGLWGRMNWTPEGRQMLQNGAFKFVSPVFLGKPIGQQNGRTIFEPVAFKSLALTNEPNLPLPPLANSKDSMTTITELLQLNADATADQILEAVRNLRTQNETLANERATRDTEFTTLKNESENLRKSVTSVDDRFKAERAARIELLLANAIDKGRITAAEQTKWKEDLTTSFDAKELELAALAPKLNTTSQTRDLGNDKNAYDTEATRRSALTAYIAEQESKGLTYDEAWQKAKSERADIFSNMARH